MKICLAYKSHPEGARDPFTSLLPAGLLFLEARLSALGHRVTLANFSGIGWSEINRILKKERPALLGISQFTHNRHESVRLARIAKELDPGCFVLLGGPHATHTALETLGAHREIDAVALGEAEETLAELVATLEAGGDPSAVAGLALQGAPPRMTALRPPIAELDLLPPPVAGSGRGIGVQYRRQLEFVITSRGCPASCLFCSSPLFWGKSVRFRSPESIVAELELIKKRYGLIYFSFRDDTFTADRERVLALCRLMEQRRLGMLWNCQSRVSAVDLELLIAMKRAGCECVQFGVESGSPAMLKALGKRIAPEQARHAAELVRRVGINLSVYLITGVPGEGEEDLAATLELVRQIRPQDGQVSPLVYYPGTRLYAAALKRGEVSAGLFDAPTGEGFPVRRDPFVERSRKAIVKGLAAAGRKGRFGAADFARQRALVGPALVTDMLEAEAREAAGEYPEALALYRELVRREPEHPWGHLLLAGYWERAGEPGLARKSYLELLRLVPAHLPALQALGELALERGDRAEARSYLQRALELEPNDRVAREGLKRAGL